MIIRELCAAVDKILEGMEDAYFDRLCIMEDIAGVSHEKAMHCYYSEGNVDEAKVREVIAAAEKRASGYPLQYILGEWEFYGFRFKVGQGVLIPRADTETIIDTIKDKLKVEKPNIVDLCSGSGCIAITLSETLKNATVTAVEKSEDALYYLKDNVARYGDKVRVIKGDIFDELMLSNVGENIDCIVSNPPYLTKEDMTKLQEEVKHEPQMALFGGDDGLDFYRVIVEKWSRLLKIGGLIVFELDPMQEKDVKEMLAQIGFIDLFSVNDATGSVRVVGGYKMEV